MPTATKARPKKPKMIPGGGPFKRPSGDDQAKLDYERRAKKALRRAIKAGGPGYEKLQTGLAHIGVTITPAALENKIARGTFSAAFLIQCLDALGVELLDVSDDSGDE